MNAWGVQKVGLLGSRVGCQLWNVCLPSREHAGSTSQRAGSCKNRAWVTHSHAPARTDGGRKRHALLQAASKEGIRFASVAMFLYV